MYSSAALAAPTVLRNWKDGTKRARTGRHFFLKGRKLEATGSLLRLFNFVRSQLPLLDPHRLACYLFRASHQALSNKSSHARLPRQLQKSKTAGRLQVATVCCPGLERSTAQDQPRMLALHIGDVFKRTSRNLDILWLQMVEQTLPALQCPFQFPNSLGMTFGYLSYISCRRPCG